MDNSFEALVDGANKWKQAKCVCALLWISVSIGSGIGEVSRLMFEQCYMRSVVGRSDSSPV